jgi:hypothetical protein
MRLGSRHRLSFFSKALKRFSGVTMKRILEVAFSCVVMTVLLANTAPAQQSLISIGPNVRVSAANGDRSHTEMNIAADPSDAKHLVACSIVGFPRPYKRTTVLYTSFDGGKTWKPTLDTSEFPDSSDPNCTIGPTGAAYLISDVRSDLRNQSTKVYRSEDGGRTWSSPVSLPAFMERASIIADPMDGKQVFANGWSGTRDLNSGRNHVGLGLSRSLNGGQSFGTPLVRAVIENERHYMVGMGNCVFLSDRTLACAVGQSDDDSPVEDQVQSLKLKARVKVIKALSGGEAFTNAVTVGSYYIVRRPPGTTSSMPSIAVDPSNGPLQDRLYLVWTDVNSGRTEITFSYSSDKGLTWSKPKRINDDQAFDVSNPALGPDDLMPTVAVNRDSVVGVSWYDRRESKDNLGWHVRFSASLDGGETFLPSVRVSAAPATFDEKTEWPIFYWNAVSGGGSWLPGGPLNVHLEISGQLFNGGDYAGLVADAGGVFHSLWADNRTGIHQLWTSAINVNAKGILHGSTDLARLEDITDKASLEIRAAEYDRSDNTLTVEVRLKNTSTQPLVGPLKIKIVSMSSDLAGQLQLKSEKSGVFDMPLSSYLLPPGETTLVKKLIFQLADINPLKRGRDIKLGVIDLDLLVLGSKPKDLDNK